MANITICLMVIADLAKSGRSVFSWAVIADLSFESRLRFAAAEYFHICPCLCSLLHLITAIKPLSSPLVTSFHRKYSKSISSLFKNQTHWYDLKILQSCQLELKKLVLTIIDSILMKARPHVHVVVTNVYGGQWHYRTLPDIGSNGGNDG